MRRTKRLEAHVTRQHNSFMSMSSDTISQIKHENFEAIAGKETSSMRAKCTNAVALEGPCPNVAGPRR